VITPRLRLEPLLPEHADAMFEGLRDRRLYAYTPDDPPASVDALRARYERLATRRSPDGSEDWLNWAIADRRSGAYLGYAQATVRGDASASVAYVLFADAWGNGYAREAMRAVLRHLAERHGCRRADASVEPENGRSIAVLEALGFVPDGRDDDGLRYRRALP
jgi:[ribosomal protein S5]-alanine N-acetyltransferase